VPDNRQVIINALPEGRLKPEDFALRTEPAPAPGEGQVLVRTLAFMIGAGQRAGLQGSASYAAAPVTGAVMGGSGAGRVEESRSPLFQPGDLVAAPTGWQDYSVHRAESLQRLDGPFDPALHLGALGTNGLTAYFGLLDVGRPRPGETVVVSAAAGSVGHTVGQIAKNHLCRVVGIAGSEEKCRMLVDELGFDVAINYKDPDFRAAFREATPNRIDVYFDNTGGDILGGALFRMNTGGRIVCCGVVSQYDTSNPGPGPRGVPGLLVNNRVRMEGFIVFDFAARYPEARLALTKWVADGTLKPKVTEFQGLEAGPEAFIALLSGATVGTTVVRVA
jgi:NADPH-dependent curcumin reductase CurA